MKLRNKKTGEILETGDHAATVWKKNGYGDHYSYNSLAELNEDWEDYKSAEPLIKDKYPREAVRSWANVVGGKNDISVRVINGRTIFKNKYGAEIVFSRVLDFTDGEFYESKVLYRSIDRLCGEE